jgi:hypothetical protein
MFRNLSAAILFAACAACASVPGTESRGICDADAATAAVAMVEAHGGVSAWEALESIYVEREHLFAGHEQPIRFNIYGVHARA